MRSNSARIGEVCVTIIIISAPNELNHNVISSGYSRSSKMIQEHRALGEWTLEYQMIVAATIMESVVVVVLWGVQ